MTGVSFVLMRKLWVGFWMRAGHQKDRALSKGLEFSAPPPFSRVWRRAENGVNNLSCLFDEASVKITIVWGMENFQVDEHMEIWGDWNVWRTWNLQALLHILCPMYFFYLDVYLYPLSGCLSIYPVCL